MKTFCQICRHPSDEGIGHEQNCPVYTRESQLSRLKLDQQSMAQIQQQHGGFSNVPFQQAMPCPHCGGHGGQHMWAGSGTCPGAAQQNLQAPFYPYGQEGPGYAQLIPNQETREILARLDRLEEENRILRDKMDKILGLNWPYL